MGLMNEPVEYTDRGFPIWAQFKDRYDANVTVVSSSLAFEDAVWIFVKGGNIDNNDGANLLTVEQAQTLRDALDSWVSSVTPVE